jgi:hypothetical protein
MMPEPPRKVLDGRRLKRVLNLDLTHCPHCGGQLRVVAAILQPQAIDKILNHLGLEAQPPPRAPARGQMAFRGGKRKKTKQQRKPSAQIFWL